MIECGNCGFENQEGARFCNQCGRELEAPSRRSERRQITVVFSDLSGFTAMSERLDAEDVRNIMEEIFGKATEVIERYGGRVDKLLGDAVMSVFGDPVSHEDDAERAVRAVLEIHAAVDQLSKSHEQRIGRPLQMHSGINTGVVVTSPGTTDTADTGPLGDTINVAARLEGLSDAGEILLGPETAALVSEVFELEDHGTHDLKGKSGPMAVSKVAGFKSARSRASRRQAEFVGRHEELGILMAAVERVQDGEATVIGIRAEAGAGKTRLLEEFRGRVADRVQWLEGRAYPYGENIPYAALIDLVSNSVGIGEDDTQDSIASKLKSEIGILVSDADRVLDPFFRLYGLPEREGAALDKESFQDRLLESVLAVVDGLCRRGPTVLVFQDLHWADPSTIGIISDLVGTMANPVVVVANYRPTFAETLPGMREVELSAMSPRQSGQIAASILEGAEPPAELIDFVVDRTDGNPFYLEEIINSLLETDTLVSDESGWSIVGSLTDADIPTSIRGVIGARIDRLQDDRRRVLREASVVGREFLYDVIRRVATTTDTLDPSLADLETADLIRERTHDADLEYFFKHALTQDVAYEGLLKKERVELHARAAAAIEAQFAGRLEEVTETLAFHYTQGQVLDKAVHYLRAAGRKAMDRYALVEAEAQFRTGYELLTAAPQTDDNDRRIIELILDWAIVFYYQAHLLRLDQILDRHQDSIERLDEDEYRMWWLVWRGHAASFRVDQTDNTRFLDEAIEIAGHIGNQDGAIYAKTWLTWSLFITGRPEAAYAVGEEIKDVVTANRRKDPYPYLKSRVIASYVLSTMGRTAEVEEMCREVISFGEEVGNNRCIAFGLQGLSLMNVSVGNFESAIDLADLAHTTAKDPIYRDTAYLNRAAAATFMGDGETARDSVNYLRKIIADGIELPAPLFVSLAEAAALLEEGKLSAGINQIFDVRDEAMATSRAWEQVMAELYIGVVYARIVTGEATTSLGSVARNPRFLPHIKRAKKEAKQKLEEAIATADRFGFGTGRYLAEIELAKLHIHNGEKEEARALLHPAVEKLSPHGEGEGLQRVRDLLAQT